MKFAALVASIALAACGGGGDDTPPGDDTPGEILVTSPGDPLGPETVVQIGPEGGVAATSDGRMRVEVPPGAVGATTAFTLVPITNGVPGALGPAWRLGPTDVTFATPVTVTFAYDAAELGATDPVNLMVTRQRADGAWSVAPTAASDAGARTVSVHALRFGGSATAAARATSSADGDPPGSDFSLAIGLGIDPARADVATGAQLPMQVQWCEAIPYPCRWEPENGVIDPDCTLSCDRDLGLELEWSVNGVDGGTPEDGTIVDVPGRSYATYTAPAIAPEPSTVLVSARCQGDCSRHGSVYALAQIKIEEKPWYVGYVNAHSVLTNAAGTWTTTATSTVTFAFDTNDQMYHPILGTIHSTLDISMQPCSTSAVFDGTLGHGDGMLIPVGTTYVYAGIIQQAQFQATVTCEDGNTTQSMLPVMLAWWPSDTPSGTDPIGPDGELAGDEQYTRFDGTVVTVDWLLEPMDPQPQ
jgi:hypothetical protein